MAGTGNEYLGSGLNRPPIPSKGANHHHAPDGCELEEGEERGVEGAATMRFAEHQTSPEVPVVMFVRLDNTLWRGNTFSQSMPRQHRELR